MRDYISLFVNGQHHQVGGRDAFVTLSEFLRTRLELVGTKIVCSEGDCGSCSVLCGRVNEANSNELEYSPIDSCIRFVFQLDGCHVVTVEGLGCEQKLSGVQQAMIDCHGSQCGFCTPGFVVAMTGLLESNDSPSESDWRHGLTGNLCRCTGYSPIIAAGLKSNRDNTPQLNRSYPAKPLIESAVSDSNDEIRMDVKLEGENQVLYCPVSLNQATKFLAEHPNAQIIAGATDVGVQFNKGSIKAAAWLDLNRVSELEGLAVVNNQIVAGARATWSQFESLIEGIVPQFHQIVSVFGSPQIRNVGTIGGNIINASPIADSIPFLMVCDAQLELASSQGIRSVNINEFYQGYKKFDLREGELLTKITIPLPADDEDLKLYKVSRRRDLDISSFTAAIRIKRNKPMGDTISEAAIALGAVGPMVLRLPKTESFLTGKPLTLETMRSAGEIAVKEITPITDVRGGEAYRLQLAKNVMLKFFHETCMQGAIA